jgi:chemotaxis signal transduction protein
VVDEVDVAPVPLTPPCYAGVLYHRGELYDVVHMGALVRQRGGEPTPAKEAVVPATRIILLKWVNRKLALIPDEIRGMVWMDNGSLDKDSEPGRPLELSARLISPDQIWQWLTELSYGPDQVRKDLHPGI